MAAKTLDDLQKFLDESLVWRRAEIVALQVEIERNGKASPSGPLTRALVRAGVALLYAHWEGYVKDACEAYLDYVAIRRLRYDQLCDEIVLTSLLALLRKVETGDDEAQGSLLDVVRKPTEARARVPRKQVVNAKSNLRYAVLVEMCTKLGLSTDKFITRRHLIDRSLCDARNEIAHGKLYYPDSDSFSALRHNVLEMLESMRSLIMIHATSSRYRALVPPEKDAC
jgi:hypothetical protein